MKESKTYEALCRLHMPRTLRDTIDLDAVTEIIDLMAGHSLSADQADWCASIRWADKVMHGDFIHTAHLVIHNSPSDGGGNRRWHLVVFVVLHRGDGRPSVDRIGLIFGEAHSLGIYHTL